MRAPDLEELTISVATEAVDALVEAGWGCPIHVCAVDAHGSISFVRFRAAGRPPVRLLHRAEREEFVPPVNVMFTNPRGEPAYLTVNGDNEIGDISVPEAYVKQS